MAVNRVILSYFALAAPTDAQKAPDAILAYAGKRSIVNAR